MCGPRLLRLVASALDINGSVPVFAHISYYQEPESFQPVARTQRTFQRSTRVFHRASPRFLRFCPVFNRRSFVREAFSRESATWNHFDTARSSTVIWCFPLMIVQASTSTCFTISRPCKVLCHTLLLMSVSSEVFRWTIDCAVGHDIAHTVRAPHKHHGTKCHGWQHAHVRTVCHRFLNKLMLCKRLQVILARR